jgi:hypothetical protein
LAGPDAYDELARRLYGLPLDEFTAERNALATGLRKEGRREEADAVKALGKPNAAAGALNRLVREHRADVEALLGAAAALREAQFGGGGDLGEATRRLRAALNAVVAEAADGLGGGSADTIARVRQSLEAAAVDDGAAEQLLQGRLVRELPPAGFGTLQAHAPASPRAPARAPAKPKRDEAALRRARQRAGRAEERLRKAEQERDEARKRLGAAEDALARAAEAATEARLAVEEAERG